MFYQILTLVAGYFSVLSVSVPALGVFRTSGLVQKKVSVLGERLDILFALGTQTQPRGKHANKNKSCGPRYHIRSLFATRATSVLLSGNLAFREIFYNPEKIKTKHIVFKLKDKRNNERCRSFDASLGSLRYVFLVLPLCLYLPLHLVVVVAKTHFVSAHMASPTCVTNRDSRTCEVRDSNAGLIKR